MQLKKIFIQIHQNLLNMDNLRINSALLVCIILNLFTSVIQGQNTKEGLVPSPTPVQEITAELQILGIDVSHFQGDVNWQDVRNANIRFVYDKASQGDRFTDPDYVQNKKGAHEAGLLHGSYHFFTSDKGGKSQAEHFVSVAEYSPGDMPPVLDLEQAGIKGNPDIPALQKEIMIWLQEVENTLNVRPIIYTNNPFANRYLNHPDFSEYELWIAEYGVSKPKIPESWKDKGWLIWQRTDRGGIEGVVGQVDHDLFNPERPFVFHKKE